MKNLSKTILVPVDFLEQSYTALEQACHVARKMDLSITLLYVMEESNIFSSIFSEDMNEKMKDTVVENLNKVAKKFSEEQNIEITTINAKGRIYSKIVEIAEMINAKFIVLGTRSVIEAGNNATGANTSRVIRYAKCPVITISGTNHYNGCRSILLPLDLSKQTRQKVNKAIEIAKYFGSTIKVMSALLTKEDYVTTKLAGQIKQVQKYIEERDIECTIDVVKASKKEKTLAQVIINYAKKQKDIDLIMVMTQQEVNWVEFFVGSTAGEIIRTTTIPVMSITPSGEDGTSTIVGY